MTRATNAVASRARRKRVLRAAKGFRGRAHSNFRTALQRLEKSWQYSYRDRRRRKRDMRRLWIARINAAGRAHGIPYGQFIHALQQSGIVINRKMLAELAVREPQTFASLVEKARRQMAS